MIHYSDYKIEVGPNKDSKGRQSYEYWQMDADERREYCDYEYWDEEQEDDRIEILKSGCNLLKVNENIDLPDEKMKWASGSLNIKVKTISNPQRSKLIQEFCPILSPPKTKYDFKIISSDGSAVDFHKSYLVNLSEAIRIRLEDDYTSELKVNFSTKSLEILRDLMYGLTTVPFDETIDKFDFDFLKFSRFLRIQPFYNLVKENIIKKLKLDEKNFIDVIKVADQLKEEALFKCCFNFLEEAKKKSETPFHDVEYWNVLAEENPSLYGKIKDIFEF